MHRRVLIRAAAWASVAELSSLLAAAPPPPPRYDHVVIVVEENKGYNTIIGSSSAPYINKLATEGVNFTNFYAFKHTSAPNSVSYTHLRAHETPEHLVCRLLLEKK